MAAWNNPFGEDVGDAGQDAKPAPRLVGKWLARPRAATATAGERRQGPVVALYCGDLVRAQAVAICTSTNPRLSLLAGTGAEVVREGGWEVKRHAEAILERERQRTGSEALAPGSVHTTAAGRLPFRAVIHCVASDAAHRSSAAVVQLCVVNALAAADAAECASVAMPVFGSGHAALPLEEAVGAMATALAGVSTGVEQVLVVIDDEARTRVAARVLAGAFETLPS